MSSTSLDGGPELAKKRRTGLGASHDRDMEHE
jgi:hypothetical protein